MCGICGVYESGRDTLVEQAVLKRMADTIRHRGPDDDGFYSAPGIGLAHRRLSIIDVTGGHQPLSNEDGSIWIAFNGEIYNFEELNHRYLSTGHKFRTRCDTETIVHLYEELGDACVAELRGMFAFALWDGRRKRLLLARDRIGKKPLFYSWDGNRLLFASEIKALFPAGGIPKDIDVTALSDFFTYQYVPAPKTIYKSVRKLRPAHYLVVEGKALREQQYWDIRFDADETISETEWRDRLLEEYRTAVKCRLISDVPLGAFLSGGVDSSSVVAVMNSYQSPVTTCSIGFPDAKYDEAADARSFAMSLNANHFEQTVQPNAMELVPELAWQYDEPFGDSSAVPTYYVSRVARQHVTVALSGDGGDENFAGYRRYKLTLREEGFRRYLPFSARRKIFGALGTAYPKLGWAPRVFRAKSTFQSLSRDLLDGYIYSGSVCPLPLKPRLFTSDVRRMLADYDSVDIAREHYERADTPDPLSRIQYVDIKMYLVDDILVKVDRASMANSLEVRCPLLDHKLMELIARIPSSLKLRNGQGKYIFKKTLEPVLGTVVLNRRKQGFSMPVAEWFRGELKAFAHDALFADRDDLVDERFVRNCWDQHQRGYRDWSALLWCVLMYREWRSVAKAA
jgi:asparagine synthase (glutamine-hydrolysing)